MASILINDKLQIKGKMSVSRALVAEDNLVISGYLSTHLYIEDINTIEINRLKLTDVEVFKEDFGSDDFNIIYNFTAKNMLLKGREEDGVVYMISKERQKEIEYELYKDDDIVLGNFSEED